MSAAVSAEKLNASAEKLNTASAEKLSTSAEKSKTSEGDKQDGSKDREKEGARGEERKGLLCVQLLVWFVGVNVEAAVCLFQEQGKN